ncbi:MAG: hypothetical protein OEY11_04295 [Gammaproteobacteria bacterium]|nr:hypothetical protein [Gammaproteobacteria bacterium]
MNARLTLPDEKKLTVIFRIEAGCLGPSGEEHVNDFCQYVEEQVSSIEPNLVHWHIVPRTNKTLPEMEYNINHKKLSHDKAGRYLKLFSKNINDFEEHLHDRTAFLVEQYLGH